MPLPPAAEESVPSSNISDQDDQDDVPTDSNTSNGLTYQVHTTITPLTDTPIPHGTIKCIENSYISYSN